MLVRSLKYCLLLSLIFQSACAKTSQIRILDKSNKVLIFIPGFKGSYLVDDKKEETIWINGYQALFGRDTLNTQQTDLRSAGVIENVSIIPLLYSYDVYGEFIQFLRSNLDHETSLLLFDYDWREDNFAQVQKLDKIIKDLKLRGVQEVTIVAHSMGGLIATYYLRYGAQLPETAVENWRGQENIKSLVLLGTPFDGSVLIFSDFIRGAKALFNDALLDATATQSFGSSYQLLPHSTTNILNENLENKNESFFISEVWDKYEVPYGVERAKRLQYLERARSFLTKINQPTAEIMPVENKILFVQGHGYKTVSKIICRDKEKPHCLFPKDERTKYEPDSLFCQNGDGVVNMSSATLPQPYLQKFQTAIVQVEGEHLEMINQEEVRNAIAAVIVGGNSNLQSRE